MSLYVTAFDGMGSGEDSEGGALQNLAGIEASDIMHIANDFLDQEGVQSTDDGDFAATADGTNLEIDVATGVAYIKNDAWAKATSVTKFWRVESDAIEVVTLDAADGSLDRIDLIVLQINDGASADDEASNVATVIKITGTPAASPTAPTVPDDALKLAEVYVSAGVTTISNVDITDSRVKASLVATPTSIPNLENNVALNGKDSVGNPKKLIKINSSNRIQVGEEGQADHTEINAGTNKLVKIKVIRNNNGSNSYINKTIILTGWDFVAGDNTNRRRSGGSISYGVTFSEIPIVTIGVGFNAVSNTPSDAGDVNTLGNSSSGDAFGALFGNHTASSLPWTAYVVSTNGSATTAPTSSQAWVINWHAIGKLN